MCSKSVDLHVTVRPGYKKWTLKVVYIVVNMIKMLIRA